MNHTRARVLSLLFLTSQGALALPDPAAAQDPEPPRYLRDRGTGVPSSMFGTYIRPGQLRIYPYYEYYLDNDFEYKPAELGYGLDQDFRGRYRASEWLLFLGYGLTDWMALEVEAAVISANLRKSASDPSPTPAEISESGLGDVETQLRVRWMRENDRRPELFSFFETVFPFQKSKKLIGTRHWEWKAGFGLIRGFSFGTVTLRVAGEYTTEESTLELGEYAVEYLKRISPSWRAFVAVEGSQDEVELITEAQWHVSDFVFLKLNNAFGLTSKATDWAPEVGVMFAFRLPND